MAVSQYIGARYVPLFYTASDNSNNWEAGVQYDPLTIVTYLNQSYTSKIPVPASVGNPADNPTYWIMTGAYSAQVDQYHQEVEDYAATMDTLLQWSNRKILFVSDSYDNVGTPGDNISDKCAGYLGCAYDRASQGGYGFTGAFTGGTKKWVDLIALTADKDTFTDIVIFGGLNDMDASFADIQTEMRNFKSYVAANYPNVQNIYCGWSGWIYGNLNTRNKAKTAFEYWNSLIPSMGWKNLNNFYAVSRDPSLFIGGQDQDHPGTTSLTIFARMLLEAITTGSCEYYHKYNLPVSFNTNYFASATANLRVDIHNNICSLYLDGVAGGKTLVADLNTNDDIQFITGTTMAIPFNDDLRFFMAGTDPATNDVLPFVLRQSSAQTLSIIPYTNYPVSNVKLWLTQQSFTYSL